jgi:thioredoxin reductase
MIHNYRGAEDMRLYSSVVNTLREFFLGKGFVEVTTQDRLSIWAAGDCTDELYHQNNIAAGDAVKALEDIYMFLKAR